MGSTQSFIWSFVVPNLLGWVMGATTTALRRRAVRQWRRRRTPRPTLGVES